MNYKDLYSTNEQSDYPNMTFPVEYTKYGKEIFAKQQAEQQRQNIVQTINYNNASAQSISANPPPKQHGGMNIGMMLPLFKAMSSKGKVGTGDLMKAVLPMLGGDNKNLGEIISAFDNLNKNTAKRTSKIESYTRVDSE